MSLQTLVMLKPLLAHGVAADARYANSLAALMWAAGNGHPGTVRLLASGADARPTDNRGKSALQMALGGGHRQAASLLGEATVSGPAH